MVILLVQLLLLVISLILFVFRLMKNLLPLIIRTCQLAHTLSDTPRLTSLQPLRIM
jgi:hypothetical protein